MRSSSNSIFNFWHNPNDELDFGNTYIQKTVIVDATSIAKDVDLL